MYLVDGYGFGVLVVKLLLNLSGQDSSLHIHVQQNPVGDHHQVAKQSHSEGQLDLTRWFYLFMLYRSMDIHSFNHDPEQEMLIGTLQFQTVAKRVASLGTLKQLNESALSHLNWLRVLSNWYNIPSHPCSNGLDLKSLIHKTSSRLRKRI